MTARISRLFKATGPNMDLCRGRKPRILPMSKQDQWEQEELHRRRQARKHEGDAIP